VFAPVGGLVPAALRAVAKGGTVVCAGIHMSDIPSMPYELLWGERTLRSVANLTRADGEEFLALAPQVPVRTEVEPYPLERAGDALEREVDSLLAFWDEVNREDIGIVERVQLGLADPAYTGGRMCYRFEEPVHRFQNMVVDRVLGVRRVPPGDPEPMRPMFPAATR
jgi:hypothetical protein